MESKNQNVLVKKQFFSVTLVLHFEPILLIMFNVLYNFVLEAIVHLVELFILQIGQVYQRNTAVCACVNFINIAWVLAFKTKLAQNWLVSRHIRRNIFSYFSRAVYFKVKYIEHQTCNVKQLLCSPIRFFRSLGHGNNYTSSLKPLEGNLCFSGDQL
jgi:hypothetical protein